MTPAASVIIPHFNDEAGLAKCLASLKQCGCYEQVEVVVVNNDKSNLDDSIRSQHPEIHFLTEPKQGAAHARNTGVRHASGSILIFTDSDCEATPDFLRNALSAGRRYDLTGGAVTLSTQPHPNPTQAFEQVFAFNQRRYIEVKGFSVTANLVTNVDVFHAVGPFRAGLSEDHDWCQRAKALGYQLVYQPDLVVYHPCRMSWAQLKAKWIRITAETRALHRTNGGSNAKWVLRAFLMPASILAHTPRVLLSPALSSPRERIGALKTLARLRLWRMGEMLRLALPRGLRAKADG